LTGWLNDYQLLKKDSLMKSVEYYVRSSVLLVDRLGAFKPQTFREIICWNDIYFLEMNGVLSSKGTSIY
jgi:hypothetical protein